MCIQQITLFHDIPLNELDDDDDGADVRNASVNIIIIIGLMNVYFHFRYELWNDVEL